MKKSLGALLVLGSIGLVSILLVTSLRAAPTKTDDRDVRFKGGIGVDPIVGVTPGPPATATLNIVRGVSPGGLPWRIGSLKAVWTRSGRIDIEGSGLVLAGGNGIGSNPVSSVVAVFFCGAGSTTPALTTAATPMNAAGNFEIEAEGFSTPPNPCVAPVLLIETAGGAWLAAGIPVVDLDE
jgi:hypothetical protein